MRASMGGADPAHLRQGEALSLLHLFDGRPTGQDRLQGPHDPDGQARSSGGRLSGASVARSAPGTGHARRASRPARGTGWTPPNPSERTHQTGGGSRTAPEASLRRHRKRDCRSRRSVFERASGRVDGNARPGTDRRRAREKRYPERRPTSVAGASAPDGSVRSPEDAWKRRRLSGDHLRAFAQRVEVADREVRIMGSHDELIRVLAASNGVGTAANSVRIYVPGWRRGRDSNPRYPFGVYSLSRGAPSTTRPPLRATHGLS